MKCVIGIDPGLSGGIAMLQLGPMGEVINVEAVPMPTRPGPAGKGDVDGHCVATQIRAWQGRKLEIISAAVESVHSMPKQGVASAFTFGKGYGKILGILEAYAIPLEEPTPQQWQKLVLAGMQTKAKIQGLA
jgi:crossover junction endodeoxyribonuclease RuvC